jgi:hypothetical protein
MNIVKEYLKLMRAKKVFPNLLDLEEVGITRGALRHAHGNLTRLKAQIKKEYATDYKACEAAEERGSAQETLLSICADLTRTHNRFPSFNELRTAGVTRDAILHHYGSLTKFHSAVAERHSIYDELFTSDVFTPEKFERFLKKIKKHKRFILTTVVAGCRVDQACYESLLKYCEAEKALPLFLPIADPARPKQGQIMFFDKILEDEIFIFDELWLNKNCCVSNILVSAKQTTPTAGLKRIGPRKGVRILAAPKLSLESVANKHKEPLDIMTTGAITEADYTTEMYMSNRTAYIAHQDHTMAAIIVEIESEEKCHIRPVEFDQDGKLATLGKIYSAKGVEACQAAAVVYPDVHVANEDPVAAKGYEEIVTLLSPDYIVPHDVLDGETVNAHERGRKITKAMHSNDLRKELDQYLGWLERMEKKAGKQLVEVKSNHPERVSRWLDSGEFMNEPNNLRIGHELAGALLDGHDPIEFYARRYGKLTKTRFLQRDESFLVGANPVELGCHGDLGAHGSRGTLTQMDMHIGRSVTMHTHVKGIVRRAWSGGTGSTKRQGWNKGPSAWSFTIVVVYPSGSREMITVLDSGTWRIK